MKVKDIASCNVVIQRPKMALIICTIFSLVPKSARSLVGVVELPEELEFPAGAVELPAAVEFEAAAAAAASASAAALAAAFVLAT